MTTMKMAATRVELVFPPGTLRCLHFTTKLTQYYIIYYKESKMVNAYKTTFSKYQLNASIESLARLYRDKTTFSKYQLSASIESLARLYREVV
jgi:hypothetical protein